MKKKFLAIAVALVLAFCLSACTASQQQTESGANITKISEWPENEYTAAVPIPQTGVPVNQIENDNIFQYRLMMFQGRIAMTILSFLRKTDFQKLQEMKMTVQADGFIQTEKQVYRFPSHQTV